MARAMAVQGDGSTGRVAADQIILQGPLKEVGLYTVKVRLAAEVEGDLKVWVVPSSGEAGSK